jgi:hypothetical protein
MRVRGGEHSTPKERKQQEDEENKIIMRFNKY